MASIDTDRALHWQDLADNEQTGQEVLDKLRTFNYRTVQSLKALLTSPEGLIGFERMSELQSNLVIGRLAERHPDVVTLPPSNKIPAMGLLLDEDEKK